MNDGNAINFLYSAAVDKYIYLVQGELVSSIVSIYNKRNTKLRECKLLTNSEDEQDKVASAWIDYIYRHNT